MSLLLSVSFAPLGGTEYLLQSQEHYVLQRPVALRSANGSLLRSLQPGELWHGGRQVSDERPPQMLMKVRSSLCGWLSFLPGPDANVTYVKDTE